MNPNPRHSFRRWPALLVAAATLAAGLTLAAGPAQAYPGDANDPYSRGALTIAPTSGLGSDPLTALSTPSGCPAEQSFSRVGLMFVDAGGTRRFNSYQASIGDVGTVGTGALTLADYTNVTKNISAALTSRALNTPSHTVYFVVTCEQTKPSNVATVPAANTIYYSAEAVFTTTEQPDLEDTATWRRGWSWKLAETAAPSKTATTTTLAASNVAQTQATLTATVAPSAATGTVQFASNGSPVGDPVTVSNGTATFTATGLTAGTSYAFTAAYSGDSTYASSTSEAQAVSTPAVAAEPKDTSVTVTVPTAQSTAPTGLKISVAPTSLALTSGSERLQGQTWDATGTLDTVTVNDDRQNASAGGWTLNGKISTLTSGSNTIAAANVGWAPEKVDGNGTAGAAVTAGSNGGLSSDKPFATGTASADRNVTTKVKATVTLKTPSDAKAGEYTGTLTLTLI